VLGKRCGVGRRGPLPLFFFFFFFFFAPFRSANMLSDVRSSPRARERSHTPRPSRIQRLVTPQRLQHKRHRVALKRRQAEKVKDEANEYAQILAKRVAEVKAQKADLRKRRASSMRK